MATVELDKVIVKAMRSTINKLISKARTQSTKAVRAVYDIKAGDLKKSTTTRRASNNNLQAFIEITGRSLPLYLFKARQVKAGASVRVRKDTGRKVIKGAFIATMPSGKIQVWQREGRKRLPIGQLFTVGPASMYEKEGAATVEKLLQDDAGKVFESELDFYLSKVRN